MTGSGGGSLQGMTEHEYDEPGAPDAAEAVDAEAEAVEAEVGAPEQPADVVRTGNAAVDEVLSSLEGLEGRPVQEHVAVFERAHEQLRAALDPDA